MRKEDLKSGMLVEFSTGEIGLVINESIVVNTNQCELLSDFCDDLQYKSVDDFHVKRVSKQLNVNMLRQYHRTKETIDKNLLWQREEK